MTRTSKILLAVLVVAVLVIGVGYAAIQNVTLNIGGEATGNPSDANFKVKYTGTPVTEKTVSAASSLAKVTAGITDDTHATIDVEGLTAKGDIVTATYTVQNASEDLSADLSVNSSINNDEYFTVETRLGKRSLTAGEATTLVVTVELIKTPITQSEEVTIGLQLTSTPVQPGEEGTSGGGSGSGGSGGGESGGGSTGEASLTNLSFENAEEYVDLGDTLNLQAKTNEGVSNPSLTWTAEDTTVLSIEVNTTDSTKVTITPLKEGETVVTVASTEDESITASVTVYALGNNVSVASLFSFEKNKKTTEGTYLPIGFSEVAGTSLATGLTIQDSTGNQYVWVEVPQTEEVYPTAGLAITEFTETEYTAIENDLHTYTSVYRNGTSYTDTWYSDAQTGLTSTQYTELKQKMLKSVYQNGGFYVGKYETGIEDVPKTSGSSSTAPTQTPVIKKNAYPYNNVTCSQAQTLASNMASGEYTSSLMFGVQWDLVLKYLETKAVEQGTELATIQSALKSNSTNWGNYSNNNWTISNENSKYYYNSTWTTGLYNGTGSKGSTSKSILLSTGASDTFSKQGIYDLAGNVWEWTLEKTSYVNAPCAYRGGDYDDYGDHHRASGRGIGVTTKIDASLWFRAALY